MRQPPPPAPADELAADHAAHDRCVAWVRARVDDPVVGLFGPTTSADGFFSYGGRAVELDLACRPCSRFGGPVCPVGDHPASATSTSPRSSPPASPRRASPRRPGDVAPRHDGLPAP